MKLVKSIIRPFIQMSYENGWGTSLEVTVIANRVICLILLQMNVSRVGYKCVCYVSISNHRSNPTVCLMKNAHGIVVFSFNISYQLIYMIKLHIFFRVASLALGQSYDCPSASEVTLKDVVKINRCQLSTNHVHVCWDVLYAVGVIIRFN